MVIHLSLLLRLADRLGGLVMRAVGIYRSDKLFRATEFGMSGQQDGE
jgi:hypothetical protein